MKGWLYLILSILLVPSAFASGWIEANPNPCIITEYDEIHCSSTITWGGTGLDVYGNGVFVQTASGEWWPDFWAAVRSSDEIPPEWAGSNVLEVVNLEGLTVVFMTDCEGTTGQGQDWWNPDRETCDTELARVTVRAECAEPLVQTGGACGCPEGTAWNTTTETCNEVVEPALPGPEIIFSQTPGGEATTTFYTNAIYGRVTYDGFTPEDTHLQGCSELSDGIDDCTEDSPFWEDMPNDDWEYSGTEMTSNQSGFYHAGAAIDVSFRDRDTHAIISRVNNLQLIECVSDNECSNAACFAGVCGATTINNLRAEYATMLIEIADGDYTIECGTADTLPTQKYLPEIPGYPADPAVCTLNAPGKKGIMFAMDVSTDPAEVIRHFSQYNNQEISNVNIIKDSELNFDACREPNNLSEGWLECEGAIDKSEYDINLYYRFGNPVTYFVTYNFAPSFSETIFDRIINFFINLFIEETPVHLEAFSRGYFAQKGDKTVHSLFEGPDPFTPGPASIIYTGFSFDASQLPANYTVSGDQQILFFEYITPESWKQFTVKTRLE